MSLFKETTLSPAASACHGILSLSFSSFRQHRPPAGLAAERIRSASVLFHGLLGISLLTSVIA
jgi:hypothetical protein